MARDIDSRARVASAVPLDYFVTPPTKYCAFLAASPAPLTLAAIARLLTAIRNARRFFIPAP